MVDNFKHVFKYPRRVLQSVNTYQGDSFYPCLKHRTFQLISNLYRIMTDSNGLFSKKKKYSVNTRANMCFLQTLILFITCYDLEEITYAWHNTQKRCKNHTWPTQPVHAFSNKNHMWSAIKIMIKYTKSFHLMQSEQKRSKA